MATNGGQTPSYELTFVLRQSPINYLLIPTVMWYNFEGLQRLTYIRIVLYSFLVSSQKVLLLPQYHEHASKMAIGR